MRSVSRTVESDAASVWRWLTVPELMSQWIHSIESIRSTDGASLGEGSVLKFIARGREHESTVIEFIPEHALTLCSTQGPVTAKYRYLVEQSGTVCRLTLSIECTGKGMARVFMPLIGFLAWHTDRGQVDELKALVELPDASLVT